MKRVEHGEYLSTACTRIEYFVEFSPDISPGRAAFLDAERQRE